MFFRYRRLFYGLAATLMAASCALMHVHRQQMQKRQQTMPFGQFTETQIVRRTQSLFHLLDPAKDCWMAFTPETSVRPHGPISRFCTVECLNGNSPDAAHLAFFQWDAVTGDLVVASCHDPDRVIQGKHSGLTPRRAVEMSWQCLRALGIAKAGSRWQCDHEARSGQDTWSLHWHSRQKNVTMLLDAASGRFRFAATGRRPGSRLDIAMR